jgi:hypothetical protein
MYRELGFDKIAEENKSNGKLIAAGAVGAAALAGGGMLLRKNPNLIKKLDRLSPIKKPDEINKKGLIGALLLSGVAFGPDIYKSVKNILRSKMYFNRMKENAKAYNEYVNNIRRQAVESRIVRGQGKNVSKEDFGKASPAMFEEVMKLKQLNK